MGFLPKYDVININKNILIILTRYLKQNNIYLVIVNSLIFEYF